MMILNYIIIVFAIVTQASAVTTEEDSIPDTFPPSQSWPSTDFLDQLYDVEDSNEPRSLQDKRSNRLHKWYSHTYVRDGFRTWLFNNMTDYFNVSMPDNLPETELLGVYEFRNGTLKHDATMGDIKYDLWSPSFPPRERIVHIIRNALAAYNELQGFLEDYVLCSDDWGVVTDVGRHLLWLSEGRVTAVIISTALGFAIGLGIAEFQNKGHADRYQLWGTGLGFGGSALLLGIIGIMQANGAFNGIEVGAQEVAAMEVQEIAAAFAAKVRLVTMLAIGAAGNLANKAASCIPRESLSTVAGQPVATQADPEIGLVDLSNV